MKHFLYSVATFSLVFVIASCNSPKPIAIKCDSAITTVVSSTTPTITVYKGGGDLDTVNLMFIADFVDVNLKKVSEPCAGYSLSGYGWITIHSNSPDLAQQLYDSLDRMHYFRHFNEPMNDYLDRFWRTHTH